jgi:Lon protease-like protein|tara:strand:+ start:472 stop:1104 length:633 start_codon:yes stop_codon:yes gene_type:complete
MKQEFPKTIPVFPLDGVIFFPKTNLPLNIFESRYLELVKDSIKNNKLMGMIQSKKDGNEVYKIGCLGKISDYEKSDDGRMLVNLTGVIRFEITKEIENNKLYREFEVKYDKFNKDVDNEKLQTADRDNINLLIEKTKLFFKKNGLLLNWNEFKKLERTQQINTLAMIAPVSNQEKQKMLETISINDKTKTLSEIIEFYLHSSSLNTKTVQ